VSEETEGARWRAARRLFESSLDRPAAERAEFISRSGETRERIDEALSLLRSHEAAGGFLSGARIGAAAEASAEPTRRERIGPWKILATLGQGGMGIVYLGERAAGDFAQRAAVKVVSGGPDNPAILARFRAERRILAALEHPGIARLLDGGTTEDGLPYFAMEYVEGESLLAFAERRGLGLRERIGLFLEVCAAVSHAHQRLIVHRDLKPGNVLVGSDGRPRLLDFGIAKLLEPDESFPASAGTVTRGGWLTPAYASPEQIRGLPTTTATDVYSLGVILYELLVGASPHPERRQGSDGVTGTDDLERGATRPSSAVSRAAVVSSRPAPESARLARDLRGDLDTIALKALAPASERRYASVDELAADLRRHLAGLPVRARPDSLGYRAAKFVRRHRVGVAAASLVLASLIAGLALALAGFVRAQRAEARAHEEAEVAGRVSEFLVELFKVSDPGEARGNAVTARELLDRGAARVEEQLTNQPAVRAKLQRAMGRAYAALGLFAASEALAEKEIAALTELHGPDSPAVAEALPLLVKARMDRGAHASARDLALRAVAIQERALGPESLELSRSLGQLGIAYWYLGEMAAARPALERSLAIQEQRLGSDAIELGGTLNNLAILDWQEGRLDAAAARYQRALALFVRAHGEDHPSVASTVGNLAILMKEKGDLERSLELQRRALAIRRKVLAADHPDVAETLNNYGDTLNAAGRPEEARRALEEALAIREKQLGADHPFVATTEYNLGLAVESLGDAAQARRLFERSLAGYTRSLGAEHFHNAYPLTGLAALDRREGRTAEAAERYLRAVALREKALGPDDSETRNLRSLVAELLRELGRTAEADALAPALR
jgi:serine/threonine-protein kinase